MSKESFIQADIKMTIDDPLRKVIFEVGWPGDTWKYIVDRQIFAEKSEWLRARLIGPWSPPPSDPPPIIPLDQLDKRGYDHLFKYFNGEKINFSSVTTARATLDAAHYCLCPEVAKISSDYLIKNLTSSTVLEVYHGLNFYTIDNDYNNQNNTNLLSQPTDDLREIAVACTTLLAACLTVIDTNPDDVLSQEKFEELTAQEVVNLSSRDELRLTKESILFNALDKWSAAECRRNGIEPTPFNKRSVLSDDTWFSVRYLLMSDKEFIQGPMTSGILSSCESAAIVAKILGHNKNHQNNMIQNQSGIIRLSLMPRKRKSPIKYKYCMKPDKKERDDNKKNRRKECASQGQRACSRVGDIIVRVLACVFD